VRAAVWFWALPLFGETFAGTQTCGRCHPLQFQRHAASMHERALRSAAFSHATALFDRPVRERSGVEFTYTITPQGLTVEARKDEKATSANLEWIFGAGTLAFTPVGRTHGRYFEHRVSWYSASQRPGMTLGHPASPPVSAAAALGQIQSADTIYRCFNCHATGVKAGPDLSAMQPGVQCERCHGEGAAHAAKPSKQNIRKLTGLSAAEGVRVCAECHRMPEEKQRHDDPMSIRFAPVGLMASKCFLASGTLTCITCHDPHGGPRPAMTHYEDKCRSCHTSASHFRSNCLSCHMRRATPVQDLTFTDHRIRIYPAALKNEAQ